MANDNYEFYKIPDASGEFVISPKESDPYAGLFHPGKAGAIATDQLLTILAEHAPGYSLEGVVITTGELADRDDYWFDEKSRNFEMTKQDIQISLPLDTSRIQGQIYVPSMRIYDLFQRPSSLMSSVIQDDSISPDRFERIAESLIPSRTAPIEYAFTEDYHNKPTNPYVQYSEYYVLRTQRWLSGPERTSSEGKKMAPIHSPHSAPIILARTVEVEYINPELEK